MPASYRDRTDADVALAIRRGDGSHAEAELVQRFARRVVLYGLRHLGGDEARANDLAQDVMLTVIEKLRGGEVRDPERIGSFVLGTARWMAHDVRRRARRAAEVQEALATESPVAASAPEPLDVEALEQALAQLPERDRAIVVLSFLSDKTANEIAEDFGLQPGNVRVIRHRAIARLSELVRGGDR